MTPCLIEMLIKVMKMKKLLAAIGLFVSVNASATIIDVKTAYDSLAKQDKIAFLKAVNSMKIGETAFSTIAMVNGDLLAFGSSGHVKYMGYDCKNYNLAFKSGAWAEGIVCNVGHEGGPAEWIFLKD